MPEGETETTQNAPANDETSLNVDEIQRERDDWKAQARKHEERAKSNATAAKELDALRKSSMSDQEKAVAEARAEARAEALRESGAARAQDALRAALAGRSVDSDALLEGVDSGRFLGEDNEPDRKAIAAWVDRLAPLPQETTANGAVDLGQGTRNSATPLNGDPLERALKAKLGVR